MFLSLSLSLSLSLPFSLIPCLGVGHTVCGSYHKMHNRQNLKFGLFNIKKIKPRFLEQILASSGLNAVDRRHASVKTVQTAGIHS